MPWADAWLAEFDQEMAGTRKTLERVPEGKPSWKPHEKSMALGYLAGHLADLPSWTLLILERDSFDIAPPGGAPYRSPEPATRKELLEMFDKNAAAARATLSRATGEQMMQPWTLLTGGKPALTLPRVALLRSFILNHIVHHRAQLGVYLRLNNIPVPALYGPSADEGKL